MSQFYVVKAGDTASTINAALASGCNLFFTPGVYHLNQTLNVTRPNTVVLGIGYPTFVPDNGVNAMQVADVDGVRIKGLLFDAGTTNSPGAADRRPVRLVGEPRGEPDHDPGRVLPHRRRDRGQGHQQPDRQQQQHDHRPHLGLARRPRQRRHLGLDATPPTPA